MAKRLFTAKVSCEVLPIDGQENWFKNELALQVNKDDKSDQAIDLFPVTTEQASDGMYLVLKKLEAITLGNLLIALAKEID